MPTKNFQFNQLSDYIFYLSELIIDSINNIEKLESYHKEVDYNLATNIEVKYINSEIYESISDKVNRRFQYLFNLVGDESRKAVSYRKYRKVLYSKRNVLKIKIEKLNEKEQEILNDFNKLRNWGLHIPESLYSAKKQFFKMDSSFILENKSTITIPTYDYFEIKFLSQLSKEISEVLESLKIILNRMKSDYALLIGDQFKVEYEKNLVKPYLLMNAVQSSWDVQTGKTRKIKT